MSKIEKSYDYFKEKTPREKVDTKDRKKWIRAGEGVDIYSMSRPKVIEVALQAGAAYKLGNVFLINTELFERYLEEFRIPGRVL